MNKSDRIDIPSESSSSGRGKSSQVSVCKATLLAKATTSSVTPRTPSRSCSSSDPSWRKLEAILVNSDTVLLPEILKIPFLNLPLISAKSFRIPAITSSSSSSVGMGVGSATGFSDRGSGGGARKEATPQSWREKDLVSSEKSSLTPRAVGLGVDTESGFFGGDFRSLPLWSSSSSSSLSEFAIVLANHDIVVRWLIKASYQISIVTSS